MALSNHWSEEFTAMMLFLSFLVTLEISNDALFIVNLTLLHTCQCFSLIAKLQDLNSLKSGSRCECIKGRRACQVPYLGRDIEQLLAAGEENLVTKFFENFTILPFMKTWLSEEINQK